MTALPINVEELLKGQIVEWERLEFKKGWNPEANREISSFQKTAMKEQTHQYTGVFDPETHQHTGVFDSETHQYTGVFTIEAPEELQLIVKKLNKRSPKKELHLTIQKLCAWQPLKDKKHFVRSYLTPMVKEGSLKYLFPEGGNSPNQAYTL